ncbi:hypothetical protein EVAR_9664_1 [Eumeta japonica]|uniref:Uncharacterized protein n=1 Tax=Eumeta variegata TaxID=151549 RepID=A0A4C1TMR7_EUMVA|nr:hypothetical protein EVAR_9664_1 [Eumeta japonica]
MRASLTSETALATDATQVGSFKTHYRPFAYVRVPLARRRAPRRPAAGRVRPALAGVKRGDSLLKHFPGAQSPVNYDGAAAADQRRRSGREISSPPYLRRRLRPGTISEGFE